MIKVFLIILNWNGAKDTIECLRSIGRMKGDNYKLKVIVIDNASSDGSVKEIQKAEINNQKEKLDFKLIRNEYNLGFSEGNNVGIKYAVENEADYILILNNDTQVDGNLIQELVKFADKNKDVGIVSPKIYFAPGYEFHKESSGQPVEKWIGRMYSV